MADPQAIARAYLSPRAQELDRLDRYIEGTQYEGRPDWFDNASETPIVERAPCIKDPIAQSAIGTHTAFVFGEGRWPKITSATSEDDRALDPDWGLATAESDTLDRFVNVVLVRYARLKEVARAMLAEAMGSRSSGVVMCVRRGQLCVETVRASWCIPTLNDLGEVLQLEIRYPYIETFFNDATRSYEKRCMLYRRVLDAKSDTVYEAAVGLENAREPDWVVNKAKTVEHGLGFCPAIWYPFMKPCTTANDVDGVAIHERQLNEIDCLNISLSQKQRAATMAGDPQMVEIGVQDDVNPAPMGVTSRGIIETRAIVGPDGKPATTSGFASQRSRGRGAARKRGAGVIWRYPDKDTTVEYLTIPPGALQAVADHAKDVRGKIAEALHAVFVDPSELHTHAEMSGKALSFLFSRQLGFCDLVRDDVADKALVPMVSMLLRIVFIVGSKNPRSLYVPGVKVMLPILSGFVREQAPANDREKAGAVWMPPRLAPIWGPYFAASEADQFNVVKLVVAALQGGTITVEMAIEKLSTSGVFDVASAKEVAEAIAAKVANDNQSLHGAIRALGAGGQTDDDGNADQPVPADAGPGQDTRDAVAAAARAAASPPSGSPTARGAKTATKALHDRSVSTSGVAESVFKQLADDFPPDSLAWVRAASWTGPMDVPLESIDFTNRDSWRATDEPDRVAFFVEKIKAGDKKPIVLVNEPNNRKMIIVDGHHRALAYEKLGMAAYAYVADVGTVTGAWETMHNSQRSETKTKSSIKDGKAA